MDRNGTSNGDKTCGNNQDDGYKYSEESTNDYRDIKHRTIGWVIIGQFTLSVILGIAASSGKAVVSIPICIVIGIIGMLAGVIVEWTRNSIDTFDLKSKLITERMMNDVQCKNLMHEAQTRAKEEYNALTLGCAKAVANRVANRILARHATRLLEPEWREAALEDTNNIVAEEIMVLEKVLGKSEKS